MITVALPVYASPIAWLAMESLCRQVTYAKWELIIYEDEQYPNGEDFYRAYWERLKEAGCCLLLYRYNEKRISLAEKWQSIFLRANEKSIGIILQGADNYSDPNRIQKASDKFKDGYDWMYSPKILFYQIYKRKTILYDLPDSGIGSDMAISKKMAQQLPMEVKWSSVDSWIFDNLKRIKPNAKIYQDESGDWLNGLATDGENRISLERKKQFDNPQHPFYATRLQADIPKEIWDRLKAY